MKRLLLAALLTGAVTWAAMGCTHGKPVVDPCVVLNTCNPPPSTDPLPPDPCPCGWIVERGTCQPCPEVK